MDVYAVCMDNEHKLIVFLHSPFSLVWTRVSNPNPSPNNLCPETAVDEQVNIF